MTAEVNSQTILYVDSDADNRAFLADEFRKRGYVVIEAEDEQEALRAVAEHSVKAVILDLELSRKERQRLVQGLQSEENGSPFVFLLVAASTMTREEAYDLGASAALAKPINPSYLISRVESLLVPASVRWRLPRATIEPGRRHSLNMSMPNIRLGRGGFSMPRFSTEEFNDEFLEGESVDFKLSLDSQQNMTLRGTGIVRYVRLDPTKRRQQAWGIEFETLDESSFNYVIGRNQLEKPISFIPKSG